MKTKSTHVIVLIVSVMMLFGSMGIAVFATDEATSDNNAAVTEQIVQDEVQLDDAAQETAFANAEAKGAALGEMKAAESDETATGSSICVITFDSGQGVENQCALKLNQPAKLAKLVKAVGISYSAIAPENTKVSNKQRLSVAEEGGQYYVIAVGDWNEGEPETITLKNSSGTIIATITARANIVSEDVGKDIIAPAAKEGLTYEKGSAQVLIEAGSTPVGRMEYTLSDPDDKDVVWSDDVNSIKETNADDDYIVYWRVVSGNNNLFVMSGWVGATIGKADPTVIAPKPINPTYTGQPQIIAEEGTTTAGIMKYYVGEEPGTKWYDSLSNKNCKQTGADKYKVWYKVEYTTDEEKNNYNNVEIGYVKAKIKKKEVALTWSGKEFNYDTNEHKPTAEVQGIDGLAVNVDGAQVDAGENYRATATELTGEAADNYKLPADGSETCEFTIKPATVTISWPGDGDNTFKYDGSPKSPVAQITDVYSGDQCGVKKYKYTADQGSHLTDGKAVEVGGYTAAVATLTNSNYEINKNTEPCGFTIEKATLDDVEVILEGWTYGKPAKEPSLILPEGVSLNDLNVKYTYWDPATNKWKDYKKGSYPETVQTYTICASITSDKYNNKDVYNEFAISPKNSKVKEPTAKRNLVYDGTNQELINAGSVEGGTMKYMISKGQPKDTSEFKSTIPAKKNAKTYEIWYTYETTDPNYTTEKDVIGGPVKATIEPKTVSVSWDKNSLKQEYTGGELRPSASVEISDGRLEFDTINVEFKFDRNGEEPAAIEVGKYTAVASLDNPNYAIKAKDKSKTFTIEPAEVEVAAVLESRQYNGRTAAYRGVSYTWNGTTSWRSPEWVNTSVTYYKDSLHVLKTTNSDGITGDNGSAPKNEGTYYVKVNATPVNPSGNYEYKSAKDQKFTISPKEVAISWPSKGPFEYNGKEQVPKAAVDTGLDEELTAVVSGAEKDAGEYTATVNALKPVDNELARNYVLPKGSAASTDYTIAPKPVTVKWANNDGCKDAHIVDGSKHKVKAAIIGAVNGEGLLPKYAPDSVIEAKTAGTYKGIVDGVLIKKLIIFKTETYNYQLVNADEEPIPQSTYAWMISNPEDDPVADVIELIKALDPNAPDYAAKAWIVVEAFNALSKDQQADSRFREQEVATKLAGAQYEVAEEADQKAAKPVMDKIDALTANSSKAEVEAARAAYNALSYAQKAACGQSRSFTLQSQEYRIYSGEAKVKKVNGYKVKNVKGKKARATWKATAGVDGYKITYKAKGVKTKTVYANASATKKTLTKLKKNKKYTVKIRSFNVVYNPLSGADEKVFGKTSTKKVKIKK